MAQYDASSPDELAFVSAAQTFGVEFFRRTSLDKLQLRLLTSFARHIILGPQLSALWDQWVSTTSPPPLPPIVNHISSLPNKDIIEDALESSPKRSLSHYQSRDEMREGIWIPVVEVELLDVLEFDNERKRMSVIIRYEISSVWSSPRNYTCIGSPSFS